MAEQPVPTALAGEIVVADERLRPLVRETPLEPSPAFDRLGGGRLFFKCEHLQLTGSFKVRGALNKLLRLSDGERAAGVVAASTGNHGAAVAYGLSRLGIGGEVFVPENASPTKVAAIRALGAEVRTHGFDGVETEIFARRYASESGRSYLSPYNDPEVVAGQGTVGVELARQLPDVDAVFVAVGGGGLISGIATHLKAIRPEIRVIGCSPQNSAVMIESVRSGRVLELESKPTLSDGTAGGIEQDAITFDLCRALVDDYETVSEAEIVAAAQAFIGAHHMLIEGAAAVPLAAYLRQRDAFVGQTVAVVLCGANISLDDLKKMLA